MDERRKTIVDLGFTQLGKPYVWGAPLQLDNADPAGFDCSCFAAWCYGRAANIILPRTAHAQWNATETTDNPLPGDLGFFASHEHVSTDNLLGVYHVGIVQDNNAILEARGHQDHSSFETGKVIRRPLVAWVNFANFMGWRRYSGLA